MFNNFMNFIISREFITFLGIIVLLTIIYLIFNRKKLSTIIINCYLTLLIMLVSYISLVTNLITGK